MVKLYISQYKQTSRTFASGKEMIQSRLVFALFLLFLRKFLSSLYIVVFLEKFKVWIPLVSTLPCLPVLSTFSNANRDFCLKKSVFICVTWKIRLASKLPK